MAFIQHPRVNQHMLERMYLVGFTINGVIYRYGIYSEPSPTICETELNGKYLELFGINPHISSVMLYSATGKTMEEAKQRIVRHYTRAKQAIGLVSSLQPKLL
jgi:hypothetical protein